MIETKEKDALPSSMDTDLLMWPDLLLLAKSLSSNGSIGDVNSNQQGTGARFNSGKLPYEVLPLSLLLDWIDAYQFPSLTHDPLSVLEWLGRWQAGDDSALMEAVNCAVIKEGLPGFAEAARVFKHVTEREINPYPMWNWMKGMPWSVPYGCAIRHLNEEMDSVEFDHETRLLHRGHVICNLIMLLLYAKTYPAGDDRPPSEFL